MCEQGSISGYITSKDIQNAMKYAKMKIMYEQTQTYQDQLSWIWTNEDRTPNYNCPSELNCPDGYVKIKNKRECNRLSNSNENTQNEINGFYLEWRPTDPNKDNGLDSEDGQCYLGNYQYRKYCELGDFANDPNHKVKGLYYDESSGKCFITPSYCSNTGQLKYNPPANNIPKYIRDKGFGGSCDLNKDQKALDFFFGSTVARGLVGGKCFK
jgi:hypothetical protein